MSRSLSQICVYCGSKGGTADRYRSAARELADEMAEREIDLVYGGGGTGLMGAIADRVLERGGEVIGVIPHGLMVREAGHDGVTEMVVVDSMHERKSRMVELADGFIALPGGLGTMEELLEVLTWAQLGVHGKPCGVLNVESYFDRLVGFFDHAVEEGFLRPDHRDLVIVEDEPETLLDALAGYEAPRVPQWISPEAT